MIYYVSVSLFLFPLTENHHIAKHNRDVSLDIYDRRTNLTKWAIFVPDERFRISKQVNKMSQ